MLESVDKFLSRSENVCFLKVMIYKRKVEKLGYVCVCVYKSNGR